MFLNESFRFHRRAISIKNTIFTSFLLVLALSVQAQQKLKLGVQAGLLANDQYSKTRFDIPTIGPGPAPAPYYINRQYPLPGYVVGITLQKGLTKRLTVGGNLSWYQSTSANKSDFISLSANTDQTTRSRYRNQYIQIPVWLQYTQATRNVKPYIRVGLAYTHLLNAQLIHDNYQEDLPIGGNGYIGFPRHDWQMMTELGVAVSKRIKLGLRYDLLAKQRSFIGVADGYYSFRNRNVGLVTEILF